MKLAATDFDGTFCPFHPDSLMSGKVPAENLEAVKKWQAAGNKFGIATGRSYGLIKYSIDEYPGLAVDFLVCNNGAVSVDGKGNLLHAQTIPDKVMHSLLDLPVVQQEDVPLIIFTKWKSYTLHPEAAIPVSLVPMITMDEARALTGTVQLSLKLRTPEEAQSVADDIEEKYPVLACNINRSYVDVNAAVVGKGWGIRRMIEAAGWEPQKILTIGDDKNDLPMLDEFSGYTVASAKPFMKERAAGVYDSVAAMLWAHQ